MKTDLKNMIKGAALGLIRKNGGTTTLEVKNELIATQPMYFWKQKDVSEAMLQMEKNGEVILYADNGKFRTYSVLGFVSSPNVEKVSLTALAKVVQDSVGKPITLTHTKKSTGDKNVMDCQILPDRNALGAFLLVENGQMKSVYPADLLEVKVDNKVYQLKGK